ncbi:MAG: hypothetical protein ACRCZJ_06950 [Erysipelotrichaceae bacterium]
MNRLKVMARALYSSKAVVKMRDMNLAISIVLFLLVTSIISVPFYIARFQVSEQDALAMLPGFEASFTQLVQQEACAFVDATLACGGEKTVSYGGYTYYLEQDAPAQAATKSVYFGPTTVVIVGESEESVVAGTYTTFGDLSFSELADFIAGEQGDAYVPLFVKNLLLSGLNFDLVMIYMTNLLQNVTYLFLASLMLFFTGLRKQRGIRYFEAFKVTIYAMVGPALLAALVGMVSTAYGSILYPVVFMARATFIYMYLIKAPKVFSQN